ncbi:MAG: tRNA 2-selenouridine(34) synthase MnmH [Bacteroidetes bacterium 4572_77]|nr:MAG: tRNA 2-selenouridine(34) synthase MnmH [Bacteroidetes bacterium 4572_77]
MPEKINVLEFLQLGKNIPIVDVRTPAEYEQGHIPGSFNIPLFTNEERVKVGIRYKQAGKEFAVQLGLEIVGPKLADYVKQAKKIANKKQLLIHCWRGGMRSGSLAWLFETAGFQVQLLEGGYKAYRSFIAEDLEKHFPIKILGGYTGSGKTDILFELQKLGEQIIDLEGLAHHKGSAFGAIGEMPQPTNEQFYNDLGEVCLALDKSKVVWIEDESVTMGRCGIPQSLYKKMREAVVYKVDVPKKERERRLVKDYALGDIKALEGALERISRKLGGKQASAALEALKNNDFLKVANISLEYYDKAYAYGLAKRDATKMTCLNVDKDDPKETAMKLIKLL